MTHAGLAHLDGLSSHKDLDLCYCRVTDAGLAQLRGMKGLGQLNFARTRATDSGLTHLSRLTRLERLNLRSTAVSKSGVAHVKKLRTLRSLDLCDTDIDEAPALDLCRTPPTASIVFKRTEGRPNRFGFRPSSLAQARILLDHGRLAAPQLHRLNRADCCHLSPVRRERRANGSLMWPKRCRDPV
jgi:hypothetical protein